MSEFVETTIDDGVATITIDRAERHNSLVPALVDELDDAVAAIDGDDTVRAAVLETAGDSFSTGGDVAAFYEHRDGIVEYAERTVGGLHDVVLDLIDLDAAIVAAVDGQVTGGSLGLLLAADVVVLGPDATITPFYASVGFSPDGGWTAILPQTIGVTRTAEILLTDATIQPATAVEWGIATELVTDDPVRTVANSRAETIASMHPGVVASTKRLLGAHRRRVPERLAAERVAFVEQIQTDEALAGMEAFLDGG